MTLNVTLMPFKLPYKAPPYRIILPFQAAILISHTSKHTHFKPSGLPVVQTLSYMGSLIPQATNRSFESAQSASKLIA